MRRGVGKENVKIGMLASPALPKLRRAQRKIAQHQARFKVLACGRRWGKTSLGMVLAAGHARAGQRVWWVAPTYSLAFDAWRTFKNHFEPQGAKKIESERHLDLPSGGSITVKSADNLRWLARGWHRLRRPR